MRNKIISAVLIAATLGMSGAAFAQSASEQVSGVITTIDLKDMTVTLADGQTYNLPSGFNIDMLNNGQKVTVAWAQVGNEKQVQSLHFGA